MGVRIDLYAAHGVMQRGRTRGGDERRFVDLLAEERLAEVVVLLRVNEGVVALDGLHEGIGRNAELLGQLFEGIGHDDVALGLPWPATSAFLAILLSQMM